VVTEASPVVTYASPVVTDASPVVTAAPPVVNSMMPEFDEPGITTTWHEVPSPENPTLQEQEKLPGVLVQVALESQLSK
jgi:hypothetical protein